MSVDRPNAGRRWGKAHYEQVALMISEGFTHQQIADWYDVKRTTVHQWVTWMRAKGMLSDDCPYCLAPKEHQRRSPYFKKETR
jgi:transposase